MITETPTYKKKIPGSYLRKERISMISNKYTSPLKYTGRDEPNVIRVSTNGDRMDTYENYHF